MSGFFKSVGKIFKKVVKAVIKIAPFALAAAAVIFTGGAALGLLPTFGAAVGGLVSSLGLSVAVSGALTGAITSAGFGAALGFITGGKKGLQKGALMGLLTGGVMGAVNPGMFGVVKGAQGVTTMNALSHSGNAFGAGAATSTPIGVGNGAMAFTPGTVTNPAALTQAPTTALAAKPITAGGQTFQPVGPNAPAAVQGAATGGIAPVAQSPFAGGVPGAPASSNPLGFLNNLVGGGSGGSGMTGLIGSVLQAVGGGGDNSSKEARKEAEKLAKFAYGGVYAGQADPFGVAGRTIPVPAPRYYYDKTTNTVIDRQQPPPEGI